jgi:hypothetical protein
MTPCGLARRYHMLQGSILLHLKTKTSQNKSPFHRMEEVYCSIRFKCRYIEGRN